MALPELSLALLPPGEMAMPLITGAAIESGKTLSGLTSAVDVGGGGLVTIKYGRIQLGNSSPANLQYWSYISNYLSSSRRSIVVPLLTDRIAPTPAGVPLYLTGIRHSDTALFSDGVGYSQVSIEAYIAAPAAVNDAVVSIRLVEGSAPGFGMWFELNHPIRSYRSYCIQSVDAVTANGDGTTTYTCAISPPLRDAISAGVLAKFDRPRCVMRALPGANLRASVEKFWWSTPELDLIESFP